MLLCYSIYAIRIDCRIALTNKEVFPYNLTVKNIRKLETINFIDRILGSNFVLEIYPKYLIDNIIQTLVVSKY